jgi:LemA protein
LALNGIDATGFAACSIPWTRVASPPALRALKSSASVVCLEADMNRWILIAGAAALFLIFLRNRLVRRRLQVDNAYGSIEAMLKKRHDLIPNLVSAVRVYMKHEEGLLERITELRAHAASGALPVEKRPGPWKPSSRRPCRD